MAFAPKIAIAVTATAVIYGSLPRAPPARPMGCHRRGDQRAVPRCGIGTRRGEVGGHGRIHRCAARAGLAVVGADGLGPRWVVLLDHLDNAGRPSAREVHPEWQNIRRGDYLQYWAPGAGPMNAYAVARIEPNRFLGLHGLSDLRGRTLDPEQPRTSAYLEGLWGFLLNELPSGRTRLVVSGYQAGRPRRLARLVYFWVFPPVVWIMQARKLAVLHRTIEQTAREGSLTIPSPATASDHGSVRRLAPVVSTLRSDGCALVNCARVLPSMHAFSR